MAFFVCFPLNQCLEQEVGSFDKLAKLEFKSRLGQHMLLVFGLHAVGI